MSPAGPVRAEFLKTRVGGFVATVTPSTGDESAGALMTTGCRTTKLTAGE